MRGVAELGPRATVDRRLQLLRRMGAGLRNYILLHIIEGYLMVPYLLHRQEHLLPPLAILSILIFGTVFGPLGVITAMPLSVVAYVWAQETIYQQGSKDR